MEGAENVQTQSMGETGGGLSQEPQSSGSGVSTGEPVAAEPTQAQHTAESQQVSEGSSQAVQESFPGVDDFDWDKWDGTDYDSFPDQVRPWATKLKDRHTESLDSLTSSHNRELDYWKRMYEALQYGDEDPRIEDMTSQIEQLTTQNQEWEQKFAQLENDINAEREEENARYFSWFEKNYEGKLEELAQNYGADKAEQMVLDLMDLGMDVHIAVEVSLMGEDASTVAKELSNKVADTNLVLEILKSRYPNQQQPKQQVVKEDPKPVSPAAQVVAGSVPVSRPAQLAKDPSPVYGSSNQRMASLMSAAENAIRKSKRR